MSYFSYYFPVDKFRLKTNRSINSLEFYLKNANQLYMKSIDQYTKRKIYPKTGVDR